MAQKQYSFDFILNAVLNGGFSGTFTKAQQEFVRLGNEIKNLQAIQRDVAAYQKQAAAVQNTTAKLDNLCRQYQLVNRQISETTGSTTALEREKLKLEQRIGNASMALDKQKEKLDATKERLDAAGVSTDNLAGKDEELKKKIEALTEEQKKAAESAGDFKTKGVEAIEAIGGAIAAAGVAEGIRAVTGAYVECVRVAGGFERAMSAVEAIADADNQEMAALTAEAKRLGATTIYTAQQSANAMEYMAMAGWNAREMLDGMQGMTSLAAAAGEDLAQVSDIVTDNLSAFGLKASDTAHFADVLAAAAANSNTNISIMGETFKSSSSVAGALGYSIEDVAVMVGLMANNAVKGSRAGTALRNIFNGLLGGATLTSEAFGELEYSAVNTDGSMKGLMETVADLRGYFDQMTEAEKVNNAMTLAGMRGYNGLLAILNATDEDFQSLYDSVNNCAGAAERMAKVKLDNLSGDVTIMKSAMEALQSTVGEQFNPELRELSQLGTELLNRANEFIKESPVLTKGIMASTGAFAAMGTAMVGVNAAVKAFRALNLAALFTTPAGPVLALAGGIAAVAGTAVGLNEALRDGGPTVRELTEAAREMNAAMEQAETAYKDTAASAMASADVANLYIDKLEKMGDAAKLSDDEQRRYQNTLALLLQIMPDLSNCISTTTDEYGRATYTLDTTTEALRRNTEEWKRNAKAQAYQQYLNSLLDEYNGVMLEAAENEIGLTRAQYELEEASEKYCAAVERMNELWQEASAQADKQNREYGTLADANAHLTQEYYNLQNSLGDLNQEVLNAQSNVEAHERAVEKDAEALAAAESKMSMTEEAVKKLTEAMGDYADVQADIGKLDLSEKAAESGRATVKSYINAAAGMLPSVRDMYARIAQEAQSAMANDAGIPTARSGSYFSNPGYANGTGNAPPGWAWVGEKGPELMRLRGGEQILPNNVSQEVARDYRAYQKYSVEYAAAREIRSVQSSTRPAPEVVSRGQTSSGANVEMHFHIGEGASPETVNAWREYATSGELRATILEVIEDAEADARRRTMA